MANNDIKQWFQQAILQADRVNLEMLPRGKRVGEVIMSEDVSEDSAHLLESLEADWRNVMQLEANARGEVVIWALCAYVDSERFSRSPAQRTAPEKGSRAEDGFQSADAEGSNKVLQTIIMKWSDLMPAVVSSQAKYIDTLSERSAMALEREREMLAMREKLLSKEHEREIEMAREGQRQELGQRFMATLDEVIPSLTSNSKLKTVKGALAKLDDDARAKLFGALGGVLPPDAIQAMVELVSDDDEERSEDDDQAE